MLAGGCRLARGGEVVGERRVARGGWVVDGMIFVAGSI